MQWRTGVEAKGVKESGKGEGVDVAVEVVEIPAEFELVELVVEVE